MLAILGGGAYYGYELFYKPKQIIEAEKAEQATAAELPPPPDPSIAVFEQIVSSYLPSEPEKLASTATALENFLADYPDSPSVDDARDVLGEIHADLLLSTHVDEGKETYTVVSGDALASVANKHKSNIELLMRANNLLSHNLSVGQKLLIPKVDFSVVVDTTKNKVILSNHGKFFRQYPILSISLPGGISSLDTKVTDKLAMKGSSRVAFGGPEYAASDRWVMLEKGIAFRAMPEVEVPGTPVAIPAGIVLARPDVEEIFSLVSRGTPVTIR
ncbi:MAG: LysM peptidoglycan-binding domain-containing protein [Chthoniobacterales bacterium]